MTPRCPKRPNDPNQLGKLIVKLSTGTREEAMLQSSESDPAAVEFARRGGKQLALSDAGIPREDFSAKCESCGNRAFYTAGDVKLPGKTQAV